jgi:hypothetical protein
MRLGNAFVCCLLCCEVAVCCNYPALSPLQGLGFSTPVNVQRKNPVFGGCDSWAASGSICRLSLVLLHAT